MDHMETIVRTHVLQIVREVSVTLTQVSVLDASQDITVNYVIRVCLYRYQIIKLHDI